VLGHAGEAISALRAHLIEEGLHLSRLERVLGDEATALRGLDLDGMAATAAEKVRISEAHQELASARGERLRAAFPGLADESLSAVRARLRDAGDLDAEAHFAELQQELLATAERVGELHRQNMVFAETGQACIERALDHVSRLRAGPDGIYAGDGRVHPERAGVIVRRKG